MTNNRIGSTNTPPKEINTNTSSANTPKSPQAADQALKTAAQAKQETPFYLDDILIDNEQLKLSLLKNSINKNSQAALEKIFTDLNIDKTNSPDQFEQLVIEVAINFLGGGLLTGGKGTQEFDGLPLGINFKIWNWIFDHLDESQIARNQEERASFDIMKSSIAELSKQETELNKILNLDFIDNSAAYRNEAIKYAEKIIALPKGKSFLSYIGWSQVGGGSGHAMIMEIIKTNDQLYDLIVYNSTGFDLVDTYLGGNKTRQAPYIRYSNIPEGKLLFKDNEKINPLFLQALLELQCKHARTAYQNKTFEHILEIFEFLESYRLRVLPQEKGASTGQRAGTCLPSVTKDLISKKAFSTPFYKRVMHFSKAQLIAGIYAILENTLSNDTRNSELARRCLSEFAFKMNRRVAKLQDGTFSEGAVVNAHESLIARATAQDIALTLKAHTAAIEAKRKEAVVDFNLSAIDPTPQRRLRKNLDLKTTATQNVDSTPTPGCIDPTIKIHLTKNSFDSFKEAIDKTFNTAGIPLSQRRMQIYLLIDQLPMPEFDPKIAKPVRSEFWDAFTLDQLKEAQKLIIDVTRNYLKDRSGPIARQLAALLPLYAINHYLALKIESGYPSINKCENLKNYQIPFTNKLLMMNGLQYFDRKEFERIGGAAAYFNNFNKTAKSGTLLKDTQETIISKDTISAQSGSGQTDHAKFWEELFAKDPAFKKAITLIGDQKYPDLTEAEIESLFQADQTRYNKYLTEQAAYERDVQPWKEFWSGSRKTRPFGNPPSEPQWVPEPKRKVNLTPDTKRHAVLETYDNDIKSSALAGTAYEHLFYLTQMSYLTRSNVNKLQSFHGFYKKAKYWDHDSYNIVITSVGCKDIDVIEDTMKEHILSNYRTATGEHKGFLDRAIARRNQAEWNQPIAEGLSLRDFNPKGSLLARLDRVLSEDKLTPIQLIYELSKDVSVLSDPSLQSMVFTLFFRSPIISNSQYQFHISLGAGDQILTDKALADNALQFINKGILYFSNEKNGIDGARFFFELAFHLSKYALDGGQPELAARFNCLINVHEWLKKTKLSDEERGALLFFNVLFLTVTPNLTLDQNAELFASWTSFQVMPQANNKFKSPFLNTWATNSLAAHAAKLSTDSDLTFLNSLGQEIFKRLQLDNTLAQENWISNRQILRTSDNKWAIDLAAGIVYTPKGPMTGVDKQLPWESTPQFTRLFAGQQGFAYRQIGQGITLFTHPDKGIFRIIRTGREYSYTSNNYVFTYAIQTKMPGQNQYFEYVSPNHQSLKNAFPDPIRLDHAFWIPENGCIYVNGSEIKIRGIITELSTLKPIYVLLDDGTLKEADPNNSAPMSLEVDYIQTSDLKNIAGLTRFDLQQSIVVTSDPLPNGIITKSVSFPRYPGLKFTYKDGNLVWNSNQQYRLNASTPKWLLGTIENFLYLESIQNKNIGIMLVPFQNILLDKNNIGPAAEGELAIRNTAPFLDKDDVQNELIGLQLYGTYEVDNGKILPTDIESKLFLAYILFSQKKYVEAIKWMRSLKPTDRITPVGIKILEMIRTFPKGEDHPDLRMVQLFALYLTYTEMQETSKNAVSGFFLEDLQVLADASMDYRHSLKLSNNISHGCRFTREEEMELCCFLGNEITQAGEALKKFLPPSTTPKSLLEMLNRRLLLIEKGKTSLITVIPGKRLTFEERSKIEELAKTRNYAPLIRVLPDDAMKNREMPILWSTLEDYIQYSRNQGLQRRHMEILYNNLLNDYAEYYKWLDRGCSLDSLPIFAKCPLKLNGTILREVYECATKGSAEAKEAMLYRFFTWRIWGSKDPLIDFFITLIKFPERYEKMGGYSWSQDSLGMLWDSKVAVEKKDSLITYYIPKEYNAIVREYGATLLNPDFYSRSEKIQQADSPDHSASHPIRSMAAFEANLPEGARPSKEPLDPAIKPQDNRWKTLKDWQTTLFVDDPNQSHGTDKTPPKDFTFDYVDDLLSEDEKNFSETLKIDLAKLTKDYKEGKKQNLSEAIKRISNENCDALIGKAQGALASLEAERQRQEKKLIALINTKSTNAAEKERDLARLGGDVDPLLNFQDCVNSLLSCDYAVFRRKNPHLSDAQIKTIAELTLEILDKKSEQAQLRRIIDWSKKIKGAEGPNRKYFCQSLYAECGASYDFDGFRPDERIALHVFSGQSGLIPFPKQIVILKKMLEISDADPTLFKDGVNQLIMGGGKTSVIAAILLYITARRNGRAAFFTVPPQLHETVSSNLAEGMHTAFGKPLHSINLDRADFTPHRLSKLLATLQHMVEADEAAVVAAVTLQGLDLEELSLSRKVGENLTKIEALKESISSTQTNGRSYKERTAILEGYSKELSALKAENKGYIQKIELIGKILSNTKKNVENLLDEVDILMDCLHELNFVDGEKRSVDPLRNELLKTIFAGLVDKKLIVDTLPGKPSMFDLVKLRSNQQALLPAATLTGHTTPVLAKYIWKNFKAINQRLGESHQDSFIRYTSGKMAVRLQHFIDTGEELTKEKAAAHEELKTFDFKILRKDLAFLLQLKTMAASKRDKDRSTANLAAQSKLIFNDLLESVLQRVGGRNYGAKTGDKTSEGKIIPFLGVNTPATTEFGYHWEAACYHYMWGLAFNPSKEQIIALADMYTSTARYYIQKNGEKFEETAEYKEFKKLFDVELDQIHEQGAVEKAITSICKNPNHLLDMQYELIARYVTYATERLSSNGYALIDLCASSRTMSGTPWNAEGYDERLASRFDADIGTEGRILHKLAERAENKEIYAIDFAENDLNRTFKMKDFLEEFYSHHKNPKKIRGIIEAGGLFESFGTNADVAQSWMEFVEARQKAEETKPDADKTVDPNIEGVLFFHKEESTDKDKSNNQPDTLYVWKKGASKPDRIGGSTEKILHAKGLTPANYLMYYDERHTTGTDVKQLPDAINILTFDSKISIRTLCQSAMRLRQFLFEQDIEFVVSKSTQATLINKGKDCQALITNAAKVQSLRKTEAMVRHFTQQINNIFRRPAVKKVREANAAKKFDNDYAEIVKKCEKFFVTFMEENPYAQSGRLNDLYQTKAMLLDLLESTHTKFKKTIDDTKLLNEVQQDVNKLRAWIEKTEVLPAKYKDIRKEGALNAQVMQEVEIQVEVNVEVQVEQEIELELKIHESGPAKEIKAENDLSYQNFINLLDLTKKKEIGSTIYSLKDYIKAYEYRYDGKKLAYDVIISTPIYATKAYLQTTESSAVISIFHPLHRPAKQILAVMGANGKMNWLLVSEREAACVKEHMKTLSEKEDDNGIKPQEVWFIQPDGSLLTDQTEELYPKENQDVALGMLEINALLGNIDYFDRPDMEDIAEEWFEKDPELKVRYLKLKTFRDEKQKRLLQSSPIIAQASGQKIHNAKASSQHMCKERMEMELKKRGAFKPKNTLDIKTGAIKPAELKKLNVEFVKFLGLNPEATDENSIDAINQIKAKLPPETLAEGEEAVQRAIAAEVKNINTAAFANLQKFQVPFIEASQIKWLPNKMVPYLTEGTQVAELNATQVAFLDEEQADLIAFVKPDFYSLFEEKWQIQGVPGAHLTKIDPDFGHFLSTAQIKQLPESGEDEFFAKLANKWTSQWEDLHGNNIRRIPEDKRDLITEEQVAEITLPSLVKEIDSYIPKDRSLAAGTFTSWVSPEMVEHVQDENIQYLNKAEQLAALPNKRLKLITEEQIPLLSNKQLLAMDKYGKIDTFRKFISEEQIRTFDSEVLIDLLEPGQITKYLTEDQVPYLKKEVTIQACPNKLVHLFDKEQIQQMASTQVPHLKGNEQIQHLNEELFPFLKAAQMRDISDSQLKHVTAAQLPGIGLNKLVELSKVNKKWKLNLRQALTDEQISAMDTKELTSLLLQEQWIHLSAEGIATLEADEIIVFQNDPALLSKIPYIPVEHLALITNRDAVQKVSSAQITKFGLEGFQNLEDGHPLWSRITEEFINGISASKLKNLTVEQLKLLSHENVAKLTEEGVALIEKHDELIDMIPFINPQFLHLIKNPKARARITAEQITAYGSQGYNKLDDRHPLWGRITPKEIAGINYNKIKNISVKQFEHIKNVETIKQIPKRDFVYLTKSQLVNRKGDRLAYIIATLTLGVVVSVFAMLASLLIPFVWAIKKEKGRQFKLVLTREMVRPFHLFWRFIPAMISSK